MLKSLRALALEENEVCLRSKEATVLVSAATAEGGLGTWEWAGAAPRERRCTESDKATQEKRHSGTGLQEEEEVTQQCGKRGEFRGEEGNMYKT